MTILDDGVRRLPVIGIDGVLSILKRRRDIARATGIEILKLEAPGGGAERVAVINHRDTPTPTLPVVALDARIFDADMVEGINRRGIRREDNRRGKDDGRVVVDIDPGNFDVTPRDVADIDRRGAVRKAGQRDILAWRPARIRRAWPAAIRIRHDPAVETPRPTHTGRT